jgi:hypothetical protein
MEEHRWRDARLLDRAGQVAAALGVSAVLGVGVRVLRRDPLDDAVAADPLRLVTVAELEPTAGEKRQSR